MKWKQIQVKSERFSGLKLRTIEIRPKTSISALVDDILEKAGIPCITEQEFNEKMENMEAIAK